MKKLITLAFLLITVITAKSQTLFVPGSVNGIDYSQSDENVGIGIDNPKERLHIIGRIRGNGTNGALEIGTQVGVLTLGATNSSYGTFDTDRPNFLFYKTVYSNTNKFSSVGNILELQVNGSTKASIDNNGKFAINAAPNHAVLRAYGATSPAFEFENSIKKLQIGIASNTNDYAYGSLPGDVIFRTLGTSGTYQYGMIFHMAGIGNDGTDYIKFGDAHNGNWMGIFNNKTVRIDGTLFAKQIKVKTNVWADFVFEKDYKLMPLNEVSEFIQVNGHLPNVPKTEEVLKDGYDVSTIDALLLQKIEELTLYVIELEKKLTSIEQNNK